jgi:hypothetical protein
VTRGGGATPVAAGHGGRAEPLRRAEDPGGAEAYKYESFDLVLHRDGEVKHIEVKGTTQTTGLPDSGIQVFLTPNEVAHASGECQAVVTCHSVALFIMTNVKVTLDTDGAPAAVGGTPWYTTRGTWPAEHLYLLPTAITCRASSQLHDCVQQTSGGYATVHAWTVPGADGWSGPG